MKRFRYTWIAVCLVLMFLGGNDLYLWWQNPSPFSISISDLETKGPPRAWLEVTDGYQDLDRAISTSGAIELEALLVPLLTTPEQSDIHVLVETHNPLLLNIFSEYHFFSDTLQDKQNLREKYANYFKGSRIINGMLASGLVATNNRQKLFNLAKQTGLNVTEDVIFLSEGKTPSKWRGAFFLIVGVLGMIKVFYKKSSSGRNAASSDVRNTT